MLLYNKQCNKLGPFNIELKFHGQYERRMSIWRNTFFYCLDIFRGQDVCKFPFTVKKMTRALTEYPCRFSTAQIFTYESQVI